MAERIEKTDLNPETGFTDLWLDGPGEFLVKRIVDQLKATPQWTAIFGDFIDPYQRMDYGERNLPSLRVYCEQYTKEFESWFINGDVVADIIFPPNLRRNELEQIPDTVSAAMLQQFRRPKLFEALTVLVPGLNELGKRFEVDKTLAFEWGENLVPLTQIRVNFRLDLRRWDEYLEETNRTKDDPFTRVLGNLDLVASTIRGLNDDNETEVEILMKQKPGIPGEDS